jgi:hypothetical protein
VLVNERVKMAARDSALSICFFISSIFCFHISISTIFILLN